MQSNRLCQFLYVISFISLTLDVSHANADEHHFRLTHDVAPLEQSITLKLDPSVDRFTGETTIKVKLSKPLKSFAVSGRDYQVTSATVTGPTPCELLHKAIPESQVKLTCEHELPAGEYQLTMTFNAPYNQKSVGLYKTIHEGTPYLFTQFEMADARRAFPVFDEPEYKIPFQLTISAPSAQRVYTNTPLDHQVVTDGETTHTFKPTPPIPSYLIAIAVGPFEEYPIKGMRIPARILTVKGRGELVAYAQKNTPKILDALEAYFGIPYVYQKLDSVGVPEFPFGAMENVGLVTYREDLLLIDEAQVSQRQKMYHFNVIAHELAHQWYGNLVTMKWWDDLWLNEAFATWMAQKITIQLMPEFNLHLMLPQNYVMQMDARSTTKPIRKPINTEADVMDGLGLAYSKGSAVLSMVENWIGAVAFRSGIRAYIKRHAYKNAVAGDLWSALSVASGQDVAAVLKSFVTQSSYPLITLTLNQETLRLTQSRFVAKGQQAPPQQWTVPVMIKYGRDDEVRTAKVLMSDIEHEVTLDFMPEWIFPNQNAFGYYRWVLPEAYFKSLLHFAPRVLSDRERTALLSSVEALLDAGIIESGQLLATLSRFVSDAHPQVARNALNKLTRLQKTFSTPESAPLWTRLFKLSAEPAIKRYGLAVKPEEEASVSELRSAVIATLGFETQDAELLKRATQAANAYLEDPKSVNPYLSQTFLNLAASHGDLALLREYQAAFETPNTPKMKSQLLRAMGFFGDPEIQSIVFAYAQTEVVTPPDLMSLFWGMQQRRATRAHMGKLLQTSLKSILTKLPPHFIPQLPLMLSGGCDEAELQSIRATFAPELDQYPELKRSLDKLTESVQTCSAKRARGLASINRYLQRL